jgi:hypothetical protein
MSARRGYTTDELRALAKDRGPFFAGNARSALLFCADVIDAATAAVEAERRRAEEYRKIAAAIRAAK